MRERLVHAITEVQDHLFNELSPFWLGRGEDEEFGGFLTEFDGRGRATTSFRKTLVSQAQALYAFATAHRNALGEGQFLDKARRGFEFLSRHFWDADHTGWHWICGRDGRPEDSRKYLDGQAYMLHALSEYAMASGDPRALEMAEETFKSFTTLAIDGEEGGFFEVMEADWTPISAREAGGGRKTLQAHLRVLGAFNSLYEASGEESYAGDVEYLMDLMLRHMIDRDTGASLPQFMRAWTPQAPIPLPYGEDGPDGPGTLPLDSTCYGRTAALAWTLKYASELLGQSPQSLRDVLTLMYDHLYASAIDWSHGGIYNEGPRIGQARDRRKGHWQQAEGLVAMLDAYLLLNEERFFRAYEAIHGFVMRHVIHHRVGEWRALLSEDGKPLREELGSGWKAGYHSMRAMIACEYRLSKLIAVLPESEEQ